MCDASPPHGDLSRACPPNERGGTNSRPGGKSDRTKSGKEVHTPIAGGNSLRAALAVAGADPDITRLVYAQMAGLSDANQDAAPAADKQSAANLWLSGD
jgi:hypothetical protein